MTITQELAAILAEVDRHGDYLVSGRAEFLVPRIEVKGAGPLALPLMPVQAKLLIKTATQATFGRGAKKTLSPMNFEKASANERTRILEEERKAA